MLGAEKWGVGPAGVLVWKNEKVTLGAEYSVVSQGDFGKRFMLKLNIIPVIPDLIKNPLF